MRKPHCSSQRGATLCKHVGPDKSGGQSHWPLSSSQLPLSTHPAAQGSGGGATCSVSCGALATSA
eukprot:3780196-Prymnesium_polylepis.1